MATVDETAVKELAERFKSYIVQRHNASAWWNDNFSYREMRWVEQFERTHIPSQSAKACEQSTKGE
jgi:hypothetical protein